MTTSSLTQTSSVGSFNSRLQHVAMLVALIVVPAVMVAAASNTERGYAPPHRVPNAGVPAAIATPTRPPVYRVPNAGVPASAKAAATARAHAAPQRVPNAGVTASRGG
jgi:hypothetical protein